MKILFVSHQAEFIYGGEICTMEILRGLQLQHEVHFASPKGPYQERVKEILGGSFIHTIPSREFSRSLTGLAGFLIAWWQSKEVLRTLVTKLKIDIIHATSLKAMVYAWPLGIAHKIVWHHHNILPASNANHQWLCWLSKRTRAIVVPSEATALALIVAGINKEKIHVVYNGFAVDRWRPRNPERRAKFVIGFIGEISERKGIATLLPLAHTLQEMKADAWELRVIGEVQSQPEFGEQILNDLAKLGDYFNYLGRREDIPAQLQEIDVLVVPSLQDPLPTVIIEAMLSGIPVIARPVGGIPEMLEHGKQGFLLDSPEAMAAHLVALMSDPDLFMQISRAARARAEQQFSRTVAVGALEQIYGKL